MSDDQPTPKPPTPAELRTMASERQRRARKATVGEVEDGLRNLMRLMKQQLAGRDALIQAQDGIIETLVTTVEQLEAAVRELNPGWAGVRAVLPDGTSPGDAVEVATAGGGYELRQPTPQAEASAGA